MYSLYKHIFPVLLPVSLSNPGATSTLESLTKHPP